MLVSLQEALAAARAEVERLKQLEAESVERSGLKEKLQELTAENQWLTEQRAEARERIADLQKAIAAAKQHGAELELQLKGARSRVAKLVAAVGAGRR